MKESQFMLNHVKQSFEQTQKHFNCGNNYVVITPQHIEEALKPYGFTSTGVIGSKARHSDKEGFQRTVARYRSGDAFDIDGLQFDLIYVSKHLGRGRDEFRLGLYRGACANQWNFGELFEVIRFRHFGNPFIEIADAIERLIAQRQKAIETINAMKARTMTAREAIDMAKRALEIRFQGISTSRMPEPGLMLTARRVEDEGIDAFSVMNTIQENLARFEIGYRAIQKGKDNRPDREVVRYLRPMKDSSESKMDLDSALWDITTQLIAA
jgi:uncharacterized protein YoaH (UPF0181 family)